MHNVIFRLDEFKSRQNKLFRLLGLQNFKNSYKISWKTSEETKVKTKSRSVFLGGVFFWVEIFFWDWSNTEMAKYESEDRSANHKK